MLANAITSLRIIFSLILIFCKSLSPAFYCFYIAAGVTDMIDGAVARKMCSVSDFGARLDSVADITFFTVSACKILPQLDISGNIWIWIAVIALIKVKNIVSAFMVQKKFVSVHSIANKATGLLLFLLPFTIGLIDIKYSAIVICGIATYAAIQESFEVRHV